MRLRWHGLILALIILGTVIAFPLPFLPALLLAGAEAAIYTWFLLDPYERRQIRNKRRRRLDR